VIVPTFLFKHSLLLKYNCNNFIRHFIKCQIPTRTVFFVVSDVAATAEVLVKVDLVDVSVKSAVEFDTLSPFSVLTFIIAVTECGVDSLTDNPLLVNDADTEELACVDADSAEAVDWRTAVKFCPVSIRILRAVKFTSTNLDST
jgi:hypothetical protein